MISTYCHTQELRYSGVELRPHFILSQFKVEGSTLAAFIGPCDVKTDHLVDWEDRMANDFIKAKSMVHFLGEFFGITLKEGIWIQRLIVSEIHARLLARNVKATRDGDDLFIQDEKDIKLKKKLTVSIVTASPVSVLLHLGVNIDAEGAPVAATGLKTLNVEPLEFISEILNWFKAEYASVSRASTKVKAVI